MIATVPQSHNAFPASSPSSKRFLFLFSDTGGGHRASAQAVKDEFARLYGDAAEIEMVDVFVEMHRWPFDRFPEWYPAAVGLNAIPWRVTYRLTDTLPARDGVIAYLLALCSQTFVPYA